MMTFISRGPVLVILFVAFFAIGYSFQWVSEGAGKPLLDMIWSGAEANQHLAGMNEAQKARHLFGTLVNDTAYPLAYGSLLAGLAIRFGGDISARLAWPALATVMVDLAENTVQAMALADGPNLLFLKTFLTPLKFGLFALATLIVVFVLGRALGRRLLSKD